MHRAALQTKTSKPVAKGNNFPLRGHKGSVWALSMRGVWSASHAHYSKSRLASVLSSSRRDFLALSTPEGD